MSHLYEFPSKSNPAARPHTATVRDDGHIWCTCPGYRNRGECWHTREVKDYAHDPTTCDNEDGCDLCIRVFNEVKAQIAEPPEDAE